MVGARTGTGICSREIVLGDHPARVLVKSEAGCHWGFGEFFFFFFPFFCILT